MTMNTYCVWTQIHASIPCNVNYIDIFIFTKLKKRYINYIYCVDLLRCGYAEYSMILMRVFFVCKPCRFVKYTAISLVASLHHQKYLPSPEGNIFEMLKLPTLT